MPFLLRFQNKHPPNPPQGGNSFSAKSSVLFITHNLFIGKFFSGNHLIENLYLLSGFRPESKLKAAQLTAELLTFPDELTSRFKDEKKPESWYEKYRQFAQGESISQSLY